MGRTLLVLSLVAAAWLLACDDDPAVPRPILGPPGSIGLYFDDGARSISCRVAVGETFPLHVLAFDLAGDPVRSVFAIDALGLEPFEVEEVVVYPDGEGFDDTPEIPQLFHLRHGSGVAGEGIVRLARITVRLVAPIEEMELRVGPSELLPNVSCPASPWYVHGMEVGQSECLDAAYEGGAALVPRER